MKKVFVLIMILLTTIITAVLLVPYSINNKTPLERTFYVGVNYTGNSTSDAKLLIERVKNYTNLFVIQSLNFSRNETELVEICDYAVAQNLNIIVNLLNAATIDSDLLTWQIPLLQNASQKWGDRFLGVYYDDEPGGIQLDYDWQSFITSDDFAPYARFFPDFTENNNESTPRDYAVEARWFTNIVRFNLRPSKWKDAGITSFTSDYAFYWWDFLGGYDVILAQLGWNHTLEQDIGLIRGAARLQEKSWGTILTWKYDEPPYIDSGDNIYKQLLMSYEAGAEYTVIFNYPQIDDNPYGILEAEHFDAIERFWNDVIINPDQQTFSDYSQAEAVLVLPDNYGWGMRHQDDKIWGMWGPDAISPKIWEISRKLLSQYELNLDIVYDDPDFQVENKYPQIYFWNQTI